MNLEKGWTPRCSPPMGSTPVCCVPARLSKGAPPPRAAAGGSPLLVRRPGTPDGGRSRANKKPRARFQARGLKISLLSHQVMSSPRTRASPHWLGWHSASLGLRYRRRPAAPTKGPMASVARTSVRTARTGPICARSTSQNSGSYVRSCRSNRRPCERFTGKEGIAQN
jgi:hypothetical protein